MERFQPFPFLLLRGYDRTVCPYDVGLYFGRYMFMIMTIQPINVRGVFDVISNVR